MSRLLLVPLLTLLLPLPGCMTRLPTSAPAQAMHEIAADRGVHLEVARLAGWQRAAGTVITAGDGRTALGTNAAFKWYVDFSQLNPPRQVRPGSSTVDHSYMYDYDIHVFDLDTGRASRSLRGHTAAVFALALTPDARIAISVATDGARAWDVPSARQLWQIAPGTTSGNGFLSHPTQVALANDGSKAYLKSYFGIDGTLEWDLHTGQIHLIPQPDLAQIPAARIGVSAAPTFEVLSPDGRWILAAHGINTSLNASKTWQILDAATRAAALRLEFDEYCQTPVWLADSRGFELHGSEWRILRVHLPADLPQREQPLVPSLSVALQVHIHADQLAVTPDGTQVIAGENLWHAAVPDRVDSWMHEHAQVSLDGHRICTVTQEDVTVYRTADPQTPELSWHPPRGPDQPWRQVQCAFVGTAAGRVYAMEPFSGGFRLVAWDLFTSARLWEITNDANGRYAVSGDGQTLVQWRGLLCNVYDAQTGQLLRHLTLPSEVNDHDQQSRITLSHDGRVAAISGVGTFFIELDRGTLLGRTDPAFSIAAPILNFDGTLALAVDDSGVVNLLDTHTGKITGRFERPTPMLRGAFTADGRIFTFGFQELCQWAKPTPESLAHIVLPIHFQGVALSPFE